MSGDLTLKYAKSEQTLLGGYLKTKAMPLNKSWFTRSLFSCPPHVARTLKVGLLLASLLLIMAPTLLTLAWHLRHGGTIECRGKLIFVPLRWTAYIDSGNNAMLTKLPLVVRLKSGDAGMSWISLGQSTPRRGDNLEAQYKALESWFWNLHSDLGQVVSGPVRMGSGPQEVFCMESAAPATTRYSASCAILGGRWRADFMGEKKDMEEFFKIIHRLN